MNKYRVDIATIVASFQIIISDNHQGLETAPSEWFIHSDGRV